MKRLLLFIPVIVFAAMGWLFFAMMENDPSELESARLNQSFPAFVLPDLATPSLSRTEQDLKGEAMLVNVWATWCPSCRDEHAYLNTLAEERGIAIIGINYKDQEALARQWLAELGNPYRFSVSDPQGRLGLDLGVYGAPETYVVDAEGVIRLRHVGVVNEAVWQNKLAAYFSDAKPPQRTGEQP